MDSRQGAHRNRVLLCSSVRLKQSTSNVAHSRAYMGSTRACSTARLPRYTSALRTRPARSCIARLYQCQCYWKTHLRKSGCKALDAQTQRDAT